MVTGLLSPEVTCKGLQYSSTSLGPPHRSISPVLTMGLPSTSPSGQGLCGSGVSGPWAPRHLPAGTLKPPPQLAFGSSCPVQGGVQGSVTPLRGSGRKPLTSVGSRWISLR